MKRKLTGEARVEIVLASFSEKGSITNFCNKHGIARSTYYAWRKALLTHLSTSIATAKPDQRSA